jgi:DNA mismatch endonuclease, patch repair protein
MKKRKSRSAKSARLTRSENMSRIRGKNTEPEMRVRRALWASGLRYRLHDRHLPGCPDLVFPARRTVIQVQGCFWHAHEGCASFRVPKTRSEWWANKFERNKARDIEVRAKLATAGWRVLVIWECETTSIGRLEALIERLRR